MEIVNVKQGSPEWFDVRSLRMTASHAQAVGNHGKGLITYIEKKMAEYYSSADKEFFSNKDMDRGKELEDQALMAYFFEKGIETKKVGFVIHNKYVGVSPDAFAEEDGLVECKCPNDLTYLRLLLTEKIDSKYIWQMQKQMLVCKKNWCDYLVFNPNFKKDTFIKRVFPDEKMFGKLEKGFKIGANLICEIKKKMEQSW